MSDLQRDKFEVWAKERFGWRDGRLEMYLGEYVNGKTFEKWQVWKAAIDSVVVRLPVTCCRTHVFEIPYSSEVGMEHDEYFEVDDIKKCLDAAGLKYI